MQEEAGGSTEGFSEISTGKIVTETLAFWLNPSLPIIIRDHDNGKATAHGLIESMHE